jgi:hypothetical protein
MSKSPSEFNFGEPTEKREVTSTKYILSNRYEYELFKEADYNKVQVMVRVKRVTTAKKECWKLYENEKEVLVLESELFDDGQKSWLRTANGFSALVGAYKSGKVTKEDLVAFVVEYTKAD